MSERTLPGDRFFPAPWTYEPATQNDEPCWLITNSHYRFYARSECFARDFVAKHNLDEGWL